MHDVFCRSILGAEVLFTPLFAQKNWNFALFTLAKVETRGFCGLCGSCDCIQSYGRGIISWLVLMRFHFLLPNWEPGSAVMWGIFLVLGWKDAGFQILRV